MQAVPSQIASQGLKEFRRELKRPLGRINVPLTHMAQTDSDTGLSLPELLCSDMAYAQPLITASQVDSPPLHCPLTTVNMTIMA